MAQTKCQMNPSKIFTCDVTDRARQREKEVEQRIEKFEKSKQKVGL